jgi:hypothetical protein
VPSATWARRLIRQVSAVNRASVPNTITIRAMPPDGYDPSPVGGCPRSTTPVTIAWTYCSSGNWARIATSGIQNRLRQSTAKTTAPTTVTHFNGYRSPSAV